MARQNRDLITKSFGGVPLQIVCVAIIAATTSVVSTTALAGRSAATTGRVTGTVHLVARNGEKLASGAYPARRVSKAPADTSELSNVIVFVQDAPAEAALQGDRASIQQRDEAFVPRVLAVSRNSVVEFPNFDPFFHDVFSLSKDATFDLGRYPKGEKRERRFTRAGIVKVYCNIHSQMSATIMVFDHHLFATPSADGSFSIDGVPPGTWRVSAWHERIGATTTPVQVSAGDTARLEFSLPVTDAK